MNNELKGWLIIGGIILMAVIVFFLGVKLMIKLLVPLDSARDEKDE